MKRIIIACGSGVATSTVANQKVSAYLDEHGYSGKYQIEQCQVSELAEKGKSADFCDRNNSSWSKHALPSITRTSIINWCWSRQIIQRR